MNPILCTDSVPAFLHFFDLSIAPAILFYTYIPVIIVSLILGFFVLYRDKKSLASKLLFVICTFFTLWVLDIFVLWIAAYNDAVMFGWQLTPVFEVPIFIFSIYLTYVITNKQRKDISASSKLLFGAIMLVVFSILPTTLNIFGYDLTSCEGVPGIFWGFMYTGEFVAIACVLGICLNRFRSLPKTDIFRKEIMYFCVGIVSFLTLFVGSNLVGQISRIQEISFIGSFGMVIFLGFLAYLIVSYKTFDIKLIATQVLVIALTILIGSQYLFPQSTLDLIIISITIAAFIVGGYFLVKSVKNQVRQKEEIEKLAVNLEKSNEELGSANGKLKELDQLKSQFVSLASHQIRAPLTAIKGYASMILEGDYGEMSAQIKNAINIIFQSTENLVKIVGDFLDISRIEQGRMVYDMKDFDLKELAENLIKELKPNIEAKGLSIDLNIEPRKKYDINADPNKIKQVIGNLIDNSIKYTPKGSITVSVHKQADKIFIDISDTGVGIPAEEIPKLFEKFTRAKGANDINVLGTGLGLYVAKEMVTHHEGKIWVESPGKNMGSTFHIELPVKNSSASKNQNSTIKEIAVPISTEKKEEKATA